VPQRPSEAAARARIGPEVAELHSQAGGDLLGNFEVKTWCARIWAGKRQVVGIGTDNETPFLQGTRRCEGKIEQANHEY
jgi:hypothetical protein